MSILLAISYATFVIYVRTKLLPEYYQFTAKGFINQQKKQKLTQSAKKTDVTLFFTKQEHINSSAK